MNAASELRKKAELCRRAASVPSDGGKHADRLLLDLAYHLEREAETIEKLASLTALPSEGR